MTTIQLSKGFSAEIDDEDFEASHRVQLSNGIWIVTRVCDVNWTLNDQPTKNYCFGRTRESGTSVRVLLHRLLMRASLAVVVDHKDGNGLNNRRDNLRTATRAENMRNQKQRADSTAPYKGVKVRKTGFYSRITLDGVETHLGVFQTPEAAARAYDAAAVQKFGEFARTNFPRDVSSELVSP